MSKWKQICTKWSKLITNITNANTEKWSIAVELHHGKCRTVVRIICSSSNAMDKKSGHFLQVFYRRAILNIWNKMCPTLLIFTVLFCLHVYTAMWTCPGTRPWWEHCFVIHKKETLMCKPSLSPRLSADPPSLSWSCCNWNSVYCQVAPTCTHTHRYTHIIKDINNFPLTLLFLALPSLMSVSLRSASHLSGTL